MKEMVNMVAFRRTKLVRRVPASFVYTVEYVSNDNPRWATGLVGVPYGGNLTSCIKGSIDEGKTAHTIKIIMLVEVNKR